MVGQIGHPVMFMMVEESQVLAYHLSFSFSRILR